MQPSIAILNLASDLVDVVQRIDSECKSLVNGIESGLVNVKHELRESAYNQSGKKLTEEPLIAWRMIDLMRDKGLNASWEEQYPFSRNKRCDMVFRLKDDTAFWVELKMAWKAWFNRDKPPTMHNGRYHAYLTGDDGRTHSLTHDFTKVAELQAPQATDVGVMLIAFDHESSPCEADISAIIDGALHRDGRWRQIVHQCWADRRASGFRITTWIWWRRA